MQRDDQLNEGQRIARGVTKKEWGKGSFRYFKNDHNGQGRK